MSIKCSGCQAASTAPKALREIADRVDAAVDSAVADHRAEAQGLRVLADAVSAGQPGDIARALETAAIQVRGLRAERIFRALACDVRISGAPRELEDLAARVRGGGHLP